MSSRFLITKKINFVMGHRVFTQNLPRELGPNKCRHLHGHEYVLEVFLSAPLGSDSMVVDFTFYNYLNNFVQTYLDHKFMIGAYDPLFVTITNTSPDPILKCAYFAKSDEYVQFDDNKKLEQFLSNDKYLFAQFDDLNIYDNEHHRSFVIVKFVPTAEEIAKWIYNVVIQMRDVAQLFPSKLDVARVRLWETAKAYVDFDINSEI